MSGPERTASSPLVLARRAALLLPLGLLSGCGLFDGLFSTHKVPLPGKREDVGGGQGALTLDKTNTAPLTLPAPVVNPDWPQSGGNPAHAMGNLSGAGLSPAWTGSIGESGGYRRRITARPVVAGGRVFTMDPDAVVTAFDLRTGRRLWRAETEGKKDRSTNVGGGVSFDGGTLYAATGRAEVLALDPARGTIRWRHDIEAPARAAPTIADGRLYVPTIEDKVVALSAKDGARIWAYQATSAQTTALGLPSPAFADGILVAGFGSGDLVALRPDSGGVIWTDSLAAAAGSGSLADLSSVRGLPVIDRGRVFAISLGGLMLSLDLRSGRRLWEHGIAGADTPWVAGDWVFVLTSDQQVAAMNRDDGGVRWIASLPRFVNAEKDADPVYWAGPVLVNGHLLVVSSSQQLVTLNAANGAMTGWRKLRAPATLAPVVAANTTLLVTDDGTLTALR